MATELEGQPFRVRILLPLAVFVGGVLVVLVWGRGHLVTTASLVGLYLVTPLGHEAWLAAARAVFGLPLLYAATVLFLVNAVVVLFFGHAVHAESFLQRLPRIGAKVRKFEEKVRSRRGTRYGLASGLFVLVALPFHSGGAIVGSLAGRAMGLDARTTVAAVLGAIALRFVVAVAVFSGLLAAFAR